MANSLVSAKRALTSRSGKGERLALDARTIVYRPGCQCLLRHSLQELAARSRFGLDRNTLGHGYHECSQDLRIGSPRQIAFSFCALKSLAQPLLPSVPEIDQSFSNGLCVR